VRRKSWKLWISIAFAILAISSGVVAQQISQKVQVTSSRINLRKIGEATIANTRAANAEASVQRRLTNGAGS
jgi:hypothetical protein